MEQRNDRRRFIVNTGKLIVGGFVGGAALGSGINQSNASGGGYFEVSANTKNLCATCAYWGGKRRISRGGKKVLASSLGSCNNPKSPNYQKTTTPETGPMKVWKKWGAL